MNHVTRARVHGVIRFFYSGDAAANADWSRLAVEGVARSERPRIPPLCFANIRTAACRP
jgi:hypothetical protein